MTKIADTAPPFCSSCFGVKEGNRYVDFEAAWDGPVLNTDNPLVGGAVKAQIDDLVLCEDCLREAFTALELTNEQGRIADLEAQLAHAKENEKRAVRYADALEDSINQRPIAPTKKRGRQPRKPLPV